MTDLQAIEQRTSRRSYTGGVPAGDAGTLADMAKGLSAEYDLHLYLEENAAALFDGLSRSYGMFQGVQSVFVLAGRADDGHGREKAGHAGERLVLEATKRGLGTCWVAGTYDSKTLAGQLPAGHQLYAVITVGPTPGQVKGREKFFYTLAHRGTKRIEQMYTTDSGKVPDWFTAGMQAVQKAPSAVNAQPVVFEYRDGKVKAFIKEGKPVQLLDLGIAKLHFELAAGGRFAYGIGGEFTKA